MQLVGQAVRHISFGRGIVTECSGEGGVVSVTLSHGREALPVSGRVQPLSDAAGHRDPEQDYGTLPPPGPGGGDGAAGRVQAAGAVQTDPEPKALSECPGGLSCVGGRGGGLSGGRPDLGPALSQRIFQRRAPDPQPPETQFLLSLDECARGGRREGPAYPGRLYGPGGLSGEECLDGTVKVHEYYRVFLPECLVVPFWPFLEENGIPASWGRVPFRHFSNQTMGEILLHLAEQTADTEQGAQMEAFCAYFCQMNHLPVPQTGEGEQVPAAAGE